MNVPSMGCRDVTLTRIAHGDTFKKWRRKLPAVADFFRAPDGGPGFNRAPFRYPVKGLLSFRETPISGEAFKYWLYAYWQRLQGYFSETDLPFMGTREEPHPDDPEGLLRHAVPFYAEYYLNDLRRYGKWYEAEGLNGVLRAAAVAGRLSAARGRRFASACGQGADTPGSMHLTRVAPTPVQASVYAVIRLRDALRRRYRFITGEGKRDIARDCARLASVSAYFDVRPLWRPALTPDSYDRMAVDIRRMAQGAMEYDWSSLQEVRVGERLALGAAFGCPDAALDAVVNGAALLEIKTARHIVAPGSSDQLLAYYLLYMVEHPEADIQELRVYSARHASWAIASVEEIAARFPLWEFGDLLFAAESEDVDKLLAESPEDFFWRQRDAASVRAWEMADQILSIGRRMERAGRIGVTEIADIREVPHVLEAPLGRPGDAYLPDRLRCVIEAVRLEDAWTEMYERRREELLLQRTALCEARERWRAYLERALPQALRGAGRGA